MEEKERDYLFDNLKVLLIVLVVFGHSLEKYIDNDTILRGIYIFIFIFHMPLFVFISGYFSKNIDKCRKNSIKDLLVPFIFLNIVWYASVGNFKFPIYYAGWTLWYLLSLFTWRFFLKDIIKVKWVMGLSIILGLLVGFVDKYSYVLSFSRIFAFLPFFLLGYYSNNLVVNKIKGYTKLIPILGLIIVGSFSLLIANIINYKSLYMAQSYKSYGLGLVQGVSLRILFYILAIFVSVFIINLVPRKRMKLSKIGTNTMIIYLGHIYFIRLINELCPIFNATIINLCTMLVLSVLICAILSLPIFMYIYNYVFRRINYGIDIMYTKAKSITNNASQ